MDRWEWTKVGTAVAAAVAVMLGGAWFAGEVMKVSYPEGRGYGVEGVSPVDLASLQRSWPAGLAQPGDPAELRGYMHNIEKAVLPVSAAGPDGPALAAAPVDLGTLLATADPAKGQSTGKICASCHTFDQGGANRVGPNLWAIVGRPVGGHAGFAYSPAISGHGGAWSYEELDRYLAGPARAIPGNKMSFAGIRNPKSRADLLAWLGTLNNTPAPFPAPKPIAETAAAGGGATASR